MEDVTIADAKARLSELVERVARQNGQDHAARKACCASPRHRATVEADRSQGLAGGNGFDAHAAGAGAKLASTSAGRVALLMLYLDTSVLVSALTKEADTARSQTWLAKQETSELTTSDWTVRELTRRCRSNCQGAASTRNIAPPRFPRSPGFPLKAYGS